MAREQRLASLHELYGSASGGASRLVVLKGSAGVGKSWLAGQFQRQLDAFSPLVNTTPLLSTLLRVTHPVLHHDRDSSLLQAVSRYQPGWPWPDTVQGAQYGGPESAVLAIADAINRAAQRQGGMCLILEDVHDWQGDDRKDCSRLWLRLMATRAPVLLLLTARSVEAGWWAELVRNSVTLGGQAPLELQLTVLDEGGQRDLTRSFLQQREYPAELDAWLAQRSEGHPLHQVELLRFLLQGGLLQVSDVGWRFQPPADQLLPESVKHLMAGRVASLRAESAPLQDLVQLIALLDRPASDTELRTMLGLEEFMLTELLQKAVSAGVLQAGFQGGAVNVSLAHPLLGPALRDAAGEATVRRLRQIIVDAAIGVAERARHARLLQHSHAARWTREALPYALATGRNNEVLELCRALLPSSTGRQQLELLEHASRASQRTGDLRAALGYAQAGESFDLQLQRMDLHSNLSDYEASWKVSLEVCDRWPAEKLGTVWSQQVYFLVQMGRMEAAVALSREKLADSDLTPVERASLLVRQAQAVKYVEGYHAAYASCAEAASLLRSEAPGSRELLVALGNLSGFGSLSGDWQQAEAAIHEAIRLSEQLVLPHYIPFLNGNLGLHLWIRGRYLEAEQVLTDGLRLSEALEMDYVRGVNLWNYGRCLLSTGRVGEATEALARSLDLAGASGPDLAEALALAGRMDEALEQLDGVVNEPNCYSHPHSRAVVWLCAGQPERAATELAEHDPRVAHGAHRAKHMLLVALTSQLLGRRESAVHSLRMASAELRSGEHEPLAAELELTTALLGLAPMAAAQRALRRLAALGASGHATLLRRLFPAELADLTPELKGAGTASREPSAGLFIRTFGGLRLPHGEWKARQSRVLLSMLVVRKLGGERPCTREELLQQLWPDSDSDRAAVSLRVTLRRLRDTIGPAATVIRTEGGEFELQGVVTDVDLFLKAVAEQQYELALGWYRGEFLPELDHLDAAILREHLRLRHRYCLLQVAGQSQKERAAELLERALADDPLDLELLLRTIGILEDNPSRRSQVVGRSVEAFRAEFGEVPAALVDELKKVGIRA